VRLIGLGLVVVGLALVVTFCGVWPAMQSGSDYTVVDAGGLLGVGLGGLLLVVGLGILLGGEGGPPRER